MKQHIFFVYHGRYPSEKAASLFAAKSAEAFIEEGIEVTLVVPRRLGREKRDPREFFGLEQDVRTVYLPTLDLYWAPVIGRYAHVFSYLVFSVSLAMYLLFSARRTDWTYSNESVPLLFATLFFRNTCYEVHDFPEKNLWMYARLFSRVRVIVATNAWKSGELQKRFGVPAEKIIIEPNAVDLASYDTAPSRAEARTRLKLSRDAKIVVYTGHLYAWKGVDTLAEAASLMPEIEVYIVGGTEQDCAHYKARFNATNMHFTGYRPHDEMPLWQRAADVLVLPNTATEEMSARYTSPMKLFEYMASGTPVVASKLPSIQEIVGDDRAILVEPDDVPALAAGIQAAIKGDSTKHTQFAREWVENHTWHKRVARIADFLQRA